MTLRHSERLSRDSDDDYDYEFPSDDEDQNPIPQPPGHAWAPQYITFADGLDAPQAAGPLTRQGAALAARVLKDFPTTPDVVETPPPHPYQTDFGPSSLTAFLRAEVDQIKRDREAVNSKRRQKQKETASPASYGLANDSILTLIPSAAPLGDRSNEAEGSATSSLRLRRSSRLLRNQPSQGPVRSSHLNPHATSFVPESSQKSKSPRFDHTSDTWSSRASLFEEHTKSKRDAVRNNVQKSHTSPLRAKLHQKGLSNSHVRYGPTAPPSEASGLQAYSRLTAQDDQEQEIRGDPLNVDADLADDTAGEHIDRQSLCRPVNSSSILDGVTTTCHNHRVSTVRARGMPVELDNAIESFDHAAIVPETIPQADKKNFFDAVTRLAKTQSGVLETEAQPALPANSRPSARLRANHSKKKKEALIATSVKQYPRVWKPGNAPGLSDGRTRSSNPANTPPAGPATIWSVNGDLWNATSQYLSTEDMKNLRLVCSTFADNFAPIVFRNVVVNFNEKFFNTPMFRKYGDNINQFGISFEYDLHGLASAQAKVIESKQDAWFGTFTWPTESYPRFPQLQAIEDLVDNNSPLLKKLLASITSASELGLCVVSGHGWLEGPDISDMALFERRVGKGSEIFGKTFKTEDVWTTFSRNELFKWGQQNTVNTTTKFILAKPQQTDSDAKEVRFLDALKVRDIDSFERQNEQYDYDSECHTGSLGVVPPTLIATAPLAGPATNAVANAQAVNVMNLVNVDALENAAIDRRRALTQARNANRKSPQWPLIFNGHNLAAEHGGHLLVVQNKTANPNALPLVPGVLNEAQVQWLMETLWGQRAFLGAYTTAIITNKINFAQIHTLRISKLSSGLLPSLEQKEFWRSLPGLKKLEIYIDPDWRQEHVIGDRAFAQNMPISPAKAAERFTEFLRRYVTKLENLHSLSIGYVGGGEHAVGIYARNRHVLPAPIVDNPDEWLLKHEGNHMPQVTKFDHVRELTFKNCWFTPWMLKAFMARSKDTSLHSLTLSSVSMTTIHDENIEKPLVTTRDGLRCSHSRREWQRENLPEGASWSRVLDAITPGKPLLEHKYEAGLIDKDENPMPDRRFPGHVQQITLNSCGYVKITLPKGRSSTYSQNAAVIHSNVAIDHGLQARKARFNGFPGLSNVGLDARGRERLNRLTELSDKTSRVMIATDGMPWLGTLTQCIHPIEKRVLEQAWQMKFGWGDDLSRWPAVEDGQFEGGTGRFSGVIKKD